MKAEELLEIQPLEDEEIWESFPYLNEQKTILKRLVVPWIKADTKNLNGRIYSSELVARETQKMKEKIKSLKIPGQLEHPSSLATRVDKIAYYLEDIGYLEDEKTGYATLAVLNTSSGKDLLTVLDSGIKLGISSRGLGSVNAEGQVNDDFSLAALDVVSNPSFGDETMFDKSNIHESLNSFLEEQKQNKENDITPAMFEEARLAGYSGTFQEFKKKILKEN